MAAASAGATKRQVAGRLRLPSASVGASVVKAEGASRSTGLTKTPDEPRPNPTPASTTSALNP
jgi:hypothetical protein